MTGQERLETKRRDRDDSRCRRPEPRFGRPSAWVAIAASVAAHAGVLLGLAILFPAIRARYRPAYYVVAYLGTAGALGGSGAASSPAAASGRKPAAPPSDAKADAAVARRPSHRRPLAALTIPERLHDQPDADGSDSDSDDDTETARGSGSARGGGIPLSGGNGFDTSGDGGGAGTGSGDGGGDGAGFAGAHAHYGSNPAPEYPRAARRQSQQGDVILRVLVAADGSVARVEIARSSGFDLLDDSALEAVRSRWRFVPAVRGGVGVESWVLVPIRFRLTEAHAGN